MRHKIEYSLPRVLKTFTKLLRNLNARVLMVQAPKKFSLNELKLSEQHYTISKGTAATAACLA